MSAQKDMKDVRMFGEAAKATPADVPPGDRPARGIKTLRREDEEKFPDIPAAMKDKVWMWLRNWKLTCRKLNWADYCVTRMIDNLEFSYSDADAPQTMPPSAAMKEEKKEPARS